MLAVDSELAVGFCNYIHAFGFGWCGRVHLVVAVYMGSSPLTFAEAVFKTSVRRCSEVGHANAPS